MSKIKILPLQEAQRIAAGEVVERPASPVKEMLENSLDAGATQISLYIEKSGKNLIRIVDNGCGMSPEDAKLCFSNHATSKISSLDDLESIGTFGFRGEALTSISSVSKVTLITKEQGTVLLDTTASRPLEEPKSVSSSIHRSHTAQVDVSRSTGIKITYENGKVIDEQSVSCPVGTDISVHDLFYNTPVRKKFLKQDETEWNQIQNLFYAVSLSHLSVYFKLFRDGKLILNAPVADTLKSRVAQLWGHNMGQQLLSVNGDSLSGLVSNHHYWRYGRQQMFFFVNNRWVKNSELSKAVMKGYRSVLPPARFPAVFVFLSVPQDMVDVNVHPRKEEVRFIKPGTIETMIHQAITKTLEERVNEQLCESSPSPLRSILRDDLLEIPQDERLNSSVFGQRFPATFSHETLVPFSRIAPPIVDEIAKPEILTTFVESPQEQQRDIPVQIQAKIIGQLLDTYIIIENNDGLLMVDQHAAHERILYEKYLKNFEQKDGVRLLFPEIVRLSPVQLQVILKEKKFFARQGIELEQIGESEIAIKSSPPKLHGGSLREIILQAVEFIEENEHLDTEVFRKKLNEHVHGHMACKMAIKAGDKLSELQMRNVLDELMQVDNRFICVHGRPTMWSVSKLEIEKKFRRR